MAAFRSAHLIFSADKKNQENTKKQQQYQNKNQQKPHHIVLGLLRA